MTNTMQQFLTCACAPVDRNWHQISGLTCSSKNAHGRICNRISVITRLPLCGHFQSESPWTGSRQISNAVSDPLNQRNTH